MTTIKIPEDYQVPAIIDKHERRRLQILNMFIDIFLQKEFKERHKFTLIPLYKFSDLIKTRTSTAYIKQLSQWIECNEKWSSGYYGNFSYCKGYRLVQWDQPLKVKVVEIPDRAVRIKEGSVVPENIHQIVNLKG